MSATPSPPTAASVASSGRQPTVLIIGACCLDRILTVDSFPTPDSKIRTTHHAEVGGGNAANTATAMAKLARARCFTVSGNDSQQQQRCDSLRIKLLTQLGDDSIATTLLQQLVEAGVDTTSILQVPNTTTSVTTILVDASNHTRTCLHTPGTCGELTVDNLRQQLAWEEHHDDDDSVVIHVHCDGRHTEAAHYLAQRARARNIPVSVDVEKDRQSPALDWLLGHATLVFTNAQQMQDHLERLGRTCSKEQPHKCPWKSVPCMKKVVNISNQYEIECYLKALEPSAFLTRWFPMPEKEVIITKGDRGAFLVRCQSLVEKDVDECVGPTNDICMVHHESEDNVEILQTTTDSYEYSLGTPRHTPSRIVSAKYLLWSVGTLKDAHVVDTTGAGDAFIAGYLMSRLTGRSMLNATKTHLQVGAWVSGHKLAGMGAQSALPTANDVDEGLGRTVPELEQSLRRDISSFRFKNDS